MFKEEKINFQEKNLNLKILFIWKLQTFFIVKNHQFLKNDGNLIKESFFFWEKYLLQLYCICFFKIHKLMENILIYANFFYWKNIFNRTFKDKDIFSKHRCQVLKNLLQRGKSPYRLKSHIFKQLAFSNKEISSIKNKISEISNFCIFKIFFRKRILSFQKNIIYNNNRGSETFSARRLPWKYHCHFSTAFEVYL